MVEYSDVLEKWLNLVKSVSDPPDRLKFSVGGLQFDSVLPSIEVSSNASNDGYRILMRGCISQVFAQRHSELIIDVTVVRWLFGEWRIAERHFVSPIKQSDEKAVPCNLCQHYIGANLRSEEGDRHPTLVCGMHPYGPEGESCEDWEKKAISSPLLNADLTRGIAIAASPLASWEKLCSGSADGERVSLGQRIDHEFLRDHRRFVPRLLV